MAKRSSRQAPPKGARASSTGGAIAKREESGPPATRMGQIQNMLNRRRPALAALLDGVVTPERLVALALESFRKTPDLEKCDDQSILCAIYEAAKLGLEPDTPAQHCYLIPYKGRATFQLGYQGAKVIAMRGRDIVKTWATNVYANDHFQLVGGIRPTIEHRPYTGRDRGAYVGTYAVGSYRDPSVDPSWEWVPLADMLKIEGHAHGLPVAQVPEDNVEDLEKMVEDYRAGIIEDKRQFWKAEKPWIKWRERMRLKSAIKRLCKQLPMEDRERKALHLDDLAESRKPQWTKHELSEVLDHEEGRKAVSQTLEAEASDVEPRPEDTPEEEGPTQTDVQKAAAEIVGIYPHVKTIADAICSGNASPSVKLEQLRRLEIEADKEAEGELTPEEEAAMTGGES